MLEGVGVPAQPRQDPRQQHQHRGRARWIFYLLKQGERPAEHSLRIVQVAQAELRLAQDSVRLGQSAGIGESFGDGDCRLPQSGDLLPVAATGELDFEGLRQRPRFGIEPPGRGAFHQRRGDLLAGMVEVVTQQPAERGSSHLRRVLFGPLRRIGPEQIVTGTHARTAFLDEVEVDKADLKRYSEFVEQKVHDLLIIARDTAKWNGRDVIEPPDLPITKGLQECMRDFRDLDEQIELTPIPDPGLDRQPPAGNGSPALLSRRDRHRS